MAIAVFAKIKDLFKETAQRVSGAFTNTHSVYDADFDINKLDKIHNDVEVENGLRILKAKIFQTQWHVEPFDAEDEISVEQAEFVENIFKQIDGVFEEILYTVFKSAVIWGTGIAEKNYRLDDGKIVLDSLKPKDIKSFEFKTDEFNNLEELIINNMGNRQALDPNKFFLLALNNEDSEPTGKSSLRPIIKWYWIKDEISRQWAMCYEKYGTPTVKGKYLKGTSKSEQNEMTRVLQNIQKNTALVFPDGWDVELMTSANTNVGAGFEALIRYCDNQIVKCILGQTLTTSEGDRVGSMALGNVHNDVLSSIISGYSKIIEETVNEQIVKQLIDFNWSVEEYPTFKLGDVIKDTKELTEIIFRLVSCEVVEPDEPWIRDFIGIPAREVEIEEDLEDGNKEDETSKPIDEPIDENLLEGDLKDE